MRKLLHCRRGSVAFGVLAAMIPLIGAVALGTEAGSWYAIQRDAQNAADAAAIAGALYIVNGDPGAASMSASATPFATKNGFLSSEVTISQPASNQSKAVIVRSQPQLLTKLFYTAPANGAIAAGNVQIGATAVAQVYTLATPCLLALTGSISFQGSPTVSSACGMVSDSTASNSIDFTGGNGINVSNVGSISGAGGCSGGGSLCSGVLTYGIKEADPYAALNTALSALSTSNFTGGSCATPGPVAYSTTATATKCYNGTPGHGNGNAGGYSFPSATLSGIYFFAGPLSIGSNVTITGTATLILLPGASLSITGNPTIELTGPTSAPQTTSVPPAISGASNASTLLGLMAGLLIYDPETTTGNGNGNLVNITGNSSSYFDGVVYAPNAAVTYTGSSSSTGVGVGCNEVIAASVKYAGNTTYLSNAHCPTPTAPIQYVALVQ